MVDTAIVGQLGQQELAALGVNNSLFGFAFVVFNFLSTATTPTVAAALSANQKEKAGETIMQALLLASVLGAAVTAGLMLNADAALQLMGLDPHDTQLLHLATEFLLIRATAAPAALLVTVCQGVFRGLQDMRTPLRLTLATNLLHLLLSLGLIFNAHMGLSGAALSTSIAEWMAAGAYLWLGWQRREELGLSGQLPAVDPRTTWKSYLPFVQAGSAVLMRTTVLLGTKTLAAAVATKLGPASIASHQVLSQVWVMSSLIIDSLAISGQTMIAVSMGQHDVAAARKITNRLLQLGVGLGTLLSAGLCLAAPVWPHLFTSDTEVVHMVSQLLPIAVAMLPLNAVVYVLDGVLVGASDFSFLVGAMVLAAGSAAGLLLAVEPLQLGLPGVWVAQAVLMAGRLATLGLRYQSSSGPLPPHEAVRTLDKDSSSSSSSLPMLGEVHAGQWQAAIRAEDFSIPPLALSMSSSSSESSLSSSDSGMEEEEGQGTAGMQVSSATGAVPAVMDCDAAVDLGQQQQQQQQQRQDNLSQASGKDVNVQLGGASCSPEERSSSGSITGGHVSVVDSGCNWDQSSTGHDPMDLELFDSPSLGGTNVTLWAEELDTLVRVQVQVQGPQQQNLSSLRVNSAPVGLEGSSL